MHATSAHADSDEAADAARPKILVAASKPAALETIVDILKPLGRPVVTATSGIEVLRRTEKEVFAVILLDVDMHELDGFATARQIKARTKAAYAPIILLGEPSENRHLVALGYESGAVDFLFTPVDADVTRAKVVALVELEQRHRDFERQRAHALAVEANAEAERAREAAKEAGRVKSEFIATMSHEFRTPLNAILGYAQLLDMGVLGPSTPAQHAHLERLQSSAQHLLRLVDDVLDVAKADADRLEVRRDDLMTGAAVSATITLVHPQATSAGIRLLDLHGESAGVPYVGDEHRVRQVLVNLISNAIKFTPPGGQITVECMQADAPDPEVWRPIVNDGSVHTPQHWAMITVEDTGPGIGPELMGQLFDPFTQGDSALTRAKGGTGLGLAISRRLARLMGGDVTVRNGTSANAANGATFTLWLPGPHTDERPPRPSRKSDAHLRLTPPLGMAGITEPTSAPLTADAYAVLHALSVRLATNAETVAERYVAALQADGNFPHVRQLSVAQLRDHVAPFIGLLAAQLMIIGETQGEAPELLEDGGQVQRLMGELHGAQRHRIGWSETDIDRETALMFDEIVGMLQSAADMHGQPVSSEAAASVTAAMAYAVNVARHVLQRGSQAALRSHRFAKAASSA
ncbi:MAG: hybrid sensor histidine kinase/response regulator [bacterium]